MKYKFRGEWLLALGRISAEKYGIAYLLLIPTFAAVFAWVPGVMLACQGAGCTKFKELYFSVVTITTLGYGDVTPSNGYAQAAAALEAILGIVLIGLFLNSLSFSISRAAQSSEADAHARVLHAKDAAKLRGFAIVTRIFINRYKKYAYAVSTPISKRSGGIDAFGEVKVNENVHNAEADDWASLVKTDFTLNDMCDLYGPTLLLSDDISQSCISIYYDALDDLIREMRGIMQNVDLHRWPEISGICGSLIESNASLDWRKSILGAENHQIGGKPLKDFIRDILSNWQGDPIMQSSNMINQFVVLYFSIKENLYMIKRYEEAVDSALASTANVEFR